MSDTTKIIFIKNPGDNKKQKDYFERKATIQTELKALKNKKN